MQNFNHNFKKPEDFLKEKSIEYFMDGDELRIKCIFSDCDINHTIEKSHLYMNKETGQFYCQKCSEKGNLLDFCKKNNWNVGDAYDDQQPIITKQFINNKLNDKALYFQNEITNEAKDYLLLRGLEEETIKYFQLGYSKTKNAISIPHFKNSNVSQIHYRNVTSEKGKRGYEFEKGAEMVLYNADKIDTGNKTCFLFEGEFDMMIAHQLGFKNVLSVPNGAKEPTKWKEQFDSFKRIFICFDNDDAGKIATRKTIKLLGENRCKNIELPAIFRNTKIKDLSDFNLVHGELAKEKFEDLVKISGQNASGRMKEFILNTKSVADILKMEARETPYIVNRMIVEGDINAITAKTGVGKSLFTLKMAEAIGGGTLFLDHYKTIKRKVLILDLEMSEHSIVERVQTVIENDNCEVDIFYKNNFNIDNKDDVKILIERIKEKHYGVIIIDTFSAAHLKEENSNTEMSQILQEMRNIINETGCTIIFLHHHGKGNVYKNADKGRGATAIAGKLSSHISLTGEKKADDYGNEKLYLTITQEKNREKDSLQPFNIEIFWNKKTNKTTFAHTGYIVKAETTAVRVALWILTIFPGSEKYTKKDIMDIGKEEGFGTSNIWNAIQTLVSNGNLKSKLFPELSKRALYYYKKEDNKLFPKDVE